MLAILTTHPIQYQVPLWQELARDGRIPFEVWYLTDHATRASYDPEFGTTFAWDIETLAGYPYRFVNVAAGATPGSFWRCRLTENMASRLVSCGARALWIQGWQVAAYWQAARMAERAGVELWLRGESNDLKPVSVPRRIAKRCLLGWLFGRVGRFLYVGHANRRLYESYGAPDARLHAAPYAVDNERFARQAAELRPQRAALRRQWGIPDDAFCILFCGKLIPKKRPADLLRAARHLHQRGTIAKIHLLFAGSGELGDELRRGCTVAFDADAGGLQASADGIGPWRPRASFAGFLNQKEISRAYVAADCLVLPSDAEETWGLVVNEAMASGLPCVASRACGCAEDLLSGHTPSRTFDVGDEAGLADAIAAIERGRSSAEAEQRRVRPYSFRATVDEIVPLYESVRSGS